MEADADAISERLLAPLRGLRPWRMGVDKVWTTETPEVVESMPVGPEMLAAALTVSFVVETSDTRPLLRLARVRPPLWLLSQLSMRYSTR